MRPKTEVIQMGLTRVIPSLHLGFTTGKLAEIRRVTGKIGLAKTGQYPGGNVVPWLINPLR